MFISWRDRVCGAGSLNYGLFLDFTFGNVSDALCVLIVVQMSEFQYIYIKSLFGLKVCVCVCVTNDVITEGF